METLEAKPEVNADAKTVFLPSSLQFNFLTGFFTVVVSLGLAFWFGRNQGLKNFKRRLFTVFLSSVAIIFLFVKVLFFLPWMGSSAILASLPTTAIWMYYRQKWQAEKPGLVLLPLPNPVVIVISVIALAGTCGLIFFPGYLQKKDCEKGKLLSCVAIGEKSHFSSEELAKLESECEFKIFASCQILGGRASAAKKFVVAGDYFKKACSESTADSCMGAASMYTQVNDLERDLVGLEIFYRTCHEFHNAESCKIIEDARVYYEKNVIPGTKSVCDQERDPKKKIANCALIANFYFIFKDYERSFPFAKKICELGLTYPDGVMQNGAHPQSLCNLAGNILYDKKDYRGALSYSKISCEAQDGKGCYDSACDECLLGKAKEAFDFLKTATRFKKINSERIRADKDLTCLKGNTDFQVLVRSL
jgi:hypothetical protein